MVTEVPLDQIAIQVITEIPNEVDHDVQDVADSESDDEEIYVHQECRLPTTNNVHAESVWCAAEMFLFFAVHYHCLTTPLSLPCTILFCPLPEAKS